MKTVVAVFRPRVSRGRRRHAVGTDAEWLALKPIQQRDAANRHVLFDFMKSIWCGAMVGCIGAALIAPQTADDEAAAIGFAPVTKKGNEPVNCGDENAKS